MMPRNLVLVLLLSVVLPGALRAGQGDVNRDGVVNVADRALLEAMLDGRADPSTAADVDGDGELTPADADVLLDILQGRPIYESVGSAVIPTPGGTSEIGELSLSSHGGSGLAGSGVAVAVSSRDLAQVDASNSPVYRLDGIPYSGTSGLTVSLPLPLSGRADEVPMLLVGEEVMAHSSMAYGLATRVVPAEVIDGRLVAELPVCAGPPPEKAGEVPATYRLFVQRVHGLAQERYDVSIDPASKALLALDLVGPDTLTAEQKQRVATALGNAAYVITSLGFDVKKRSKPVKIEIKPLAAGTCGLYQPSMVSLNWTSIDINEKLVTDPSRVTTLQQTLFHEYFHMIQAWYDPRSVFVQAKYNAPQLWIDEASAVWIEQFAAGGTTGSYMETNAGEIMTNLHVDCEGLAWTNSAAHTKAQYHGYGMSLMLQYLFSKPVCDPNPTLINIYNALAAGTAPEKAFLDSVPDPATWWDDMLHSYIGCKIGIPPVPFPSTRRNSAKSIMFSADHAMSKPVERTLMRHDRFQSSSALINWTRKYPPADGNRRLVAQLLTDDTNTTLTAFQRRPGSDSPSVLRGTATHLGKYQGRELSLLTDDMELFAEGRAAAPGHYLLTRRLLDSAANAAPPELSVWYVDTKIPIQFTQGTPTKRYYKVTGHFECNQIVFSDSPTITNTQGSIGVEPEGTIHIPMDITITGSAETRSFYQTLSYTVDVHHALADGSTTVETLGTVPYSDSVNLPFTMSMSEDEVALVLIIQAAEDITPEAPSGYYFLGTNMVVALVFRYDYWLGVTPP